MPNAKTKVVGYIRVSTEEQAKGGVSLEAQEKKIRAYCELYDLELTEIFVDAGASGKSLKKRPELAAALSYLEKDWGWASGLVVAKLDRLTRSVRDLDTLISTYFGERSKHESSLFSVADQVDTRSASGRLILNVLMSVAQWERETISERTKDALAHKRSKGERISRRIPYGYQLGVDGVHLVPNNLEREAAALAQNWHFLGNSLRKIGDMLWAGGYTQRNGRAWHPSSVKALLSIDLDARPHQH
jgi:DNA invertase Pin-like site-specific DNA recombinase